MADPLVRISPEAHATLKELARQTKRPMADVFDEVIDTEFRRRFFEQIKEGYAQLRADPKAWAEYQAELREWDVTLMDGLDPNERWEETPEGMARPVEPKRRRKRS